MVLDRPVKQPVVSEYAAVHAGVDFEGVDARKQGLKKAGLQSCSLLFKKRKALDEDSLDLKLNAQGCCAQLLCEPEVAPLV